MADFQPVAPNRYSGKFWRYAGNYTFAGTDAICQLLAQELPRAMLAMPVAFTAEGGRFFPVAVQSLIPGKNLFVSETGDWLNSYVPSLYRGYPFRLAQTEQDEHILCFDDASGLANDSTGEPFFDVEGKPGAAVRELVEFFQHVEANRVLTNGACEVLQKHQLIQPWPITIKTENGQHNVDGLFRIDEVALNALPAEALLEVRAVGGLTIAYCQLLSMQHLTALGKLADAYAANEKLRGSGDANPEFMSKGGTFSF